MKQSLITTAAAATATGACIYYCVYVMQRRHRFNWKDKNRKLQRLARTATPQQVVAALRHDGAVIVEDLVTTNIVDQLSADVLSLEHTEFSGAPNSFAGQSTRRCGPYLLAHSAVARQLAAHPLHIKVSDLLLGNISRRIRLSVAVCIRVLAQQTAQILHRDDEEWPLALLGKINDGVEVECSAMWAITEFRDTNGATNIVLGSHGRHDPKDPQPPFSQCQQATMSAGSVLFFTGSVWHGAGEASQCDAAAPGRMGFLVQHIAGFLHPEYNLHFAVEPQQAKKWDGPLRSLLGYDGPDLFPKAGLAGPVYATEYTGYPDRDDADFSAPLPYPYNA